MSALPAELCRIERWRGYVSSSFTVRLPDGSVLESPRFRWRHAAPPPATASARAAYGELVARLEAAGWTRHANGADWFATTFIRPAASGQERSPQSGPEGLPDEPPPPPPVPPPEPRERADPDVPAAGDPRPPGRPPAPGGAGRRPSPLALAAVAVLVAAVVASALVVLLGDGDGARRSASRPAPRGRPATTAPARAGAGNTPASAAAEPLVDLRLAARGSGSWVEVRRTSATGPVLYRATLAGGQTLHLRAPKLWARFGAASNLTITADGRPVELQGTYDKLFVPPS